MMMYSYYKFRAYPNSTQREYIDRALKAVTLTYNYAAEHMNNVLMYENVMEENYTDSGYSRYLRVTEIREKYPEELNGIAFRTLNYVLRYWIQEAYRSNYIKHERYLPIKTEDFTTFSTGQFASVNKNTKQITSYGLRIIDNNHMNVPQMGIMKVIVTRFPPKDSVIFNGFITKDKFGDYFLSIGVKYEIEKLENHPIIRPIGIDLDCTDLYVDSYGNRPGFIKPFKTYETKIAEYTRRLERMVPNSNNYLELKEKLARLHQKTSAWRRTQLENISRYIVDNYYPIFVENFSIGRKLHENEWREIRRSSFDNAFGLFVRLLDQKSKAKYFHGVYKIDPKFPSTRLCSVCGYYNHDITINDKFWSCPNCGTYLDRDINAAINIRNNGMEIYGFNNLYSIPYNIPNYSYVK